MQAQLVETEQRLHKAMTLLKLGRTELDRDRSAFLAEKAAFAAQRCTLQQPAWDAIPSYSPDAACAVRQCSAV